MKYMLLIYSDENGWTREEWTQCTVDSSAICYELAAKQQFLSASPLHPVATATSVRVRDGKRLVTAGPYAETTEQLGGYYIVDVPDLDAAINLAGRLPPAKKGAVEIRPVVELDGLPKGKPVVTEDGSKRLMLLSYDDEQYWKDAGEVAHRAAMQEALGLVERIHAKGQYVSVAPLHFSETATCVRVRDGKRIVTDGPFAETHEILGGYYIVSVKSVDEAIAIAEQHPGVRVGTVEIRQLYDLPPVPQPDKTEIMSSRDFHFPREAVFAAFADPKCLAQWWGPTGFTNTFEKFDFQPGGEWKFVMHGPNGANYENYNVFDVIVPSERIEFEHVWAPKFRMTMTFADLPKQRTRVVWRMKFATEELRNQIVKVAGDGNEQNFDRWIAQLQATR